MQADKLRELRELRAKATPGEWMLATSCSWRRILTTDGKPVIVPTTQRSDNHPDMDCGDDYANAELAIAAVNALPALLAIAEAAEDLRADAMRWRFVREHWGHLYDRYVDDGPRVESVYIDELDGWLVDPLTLDAAIDSAISGGGTTNG